MKRRRVLYLVAGVALLAAAFLVWLRGPKEPVYQGKALTQWINEAHDVGGFEQTEEMNAAMRAIGTNAVPFLLREFTRPISRWRGRLCAWVNCHPSPTVRAAAVVPWSMVVENQGDIVPRLVTFASDPSPLVRQAATNQLAWLRRQHGNPFGTAAAEALRKLQTNALPKAGP